jgi:cytochrome c
MHSAPFVVATLLLVPLAAHAAGADVPPALAKHDCLICHAVDEPKTGPAFVEIGERYRGDAHAAEKLRAVLQKGAHGGGPWHMPPSPQVPAADARSIVAWILALKAPAAAGPK